MRISMVSLWAAMFFAGLILFGKGEARAEGTDTLPVEERLVREVALPDLLALAWERNPLIRSARSQWDASKESTGVKGGYPDPVINVTYFPEPIETRLGPQDWNLVISQPVPFPGKLGKAGEMETLGAKIAGLNLDMTVRKINADLAAAFYELLYIQQAMDVARRSARLLDELRKIGETAHGRERATLVDVVKAQSQAGQIRYDLLLLDELARREKSGINGLLNRHPRAPLGRASAKGVRRIVLSLDEIHTLAEERNETIRMARLSIEKAGIGSDLARLGNFPDFKVGFFYAGIGDPDVVSPPDDAGDDALGIQFGMTIPLWTGKNRSRMARARALEEKAKAVAAARINSVRTEISNLWFRLRNAGRLITLYRDDLIPQAMGSLVTAETWFREGEGGFSDFMEARNTVYNFQLSLARACADHGKTLARLEQLAGTSLSGPEVAATPDLREESEAFEAVKKRIKDARTRWEKAAEKGEGFISMAPSMAASLEQASWDDGFAAARLNREFTLETLEILTLFRNPSIRRAKKELLGAVQTFTQVMNLDEILRQYAAFTEGISLPVGPVKGREPPGSQFPFPGVTALKGRVAEETVRQAAEKLSMARRDAVTAVRKIYWNLLFTAEARRITTETLGLFNHLLSVADTRYRSGKTSFQDVNKIIIRTRLLNEALVTLKEKELNLQAGLLALLFLPPDTPVASPAARAPSTALPNLDSLYPPAMEHRQEIRLVSAKQAKVAGMLEMAETMILPPFTLNMSSYSDKAVVQTGSAAVTPAFAQGPELAPKPWFGTNDAWLAQTRQKLSALGAAHDAAVAMTRRAVREAWFELDRAIREEALYRKSIVGLSRSTLDVSTRGYEAGKVSFADVIQSYAGWLDARTALARKKSDIGVARAVLDAAVGRASKDIP
ncbi:MAG: TolC family protein [Desulfobacteraceae bacterium]|nr:TolC family protein [Desulfobacteraceae bacterium]